MSFRDAVASWKALSEADRTKALEIVNDPTNAVNNALRQYWNQPCALQSALRRLLEPGGTDDLVFVIEVTTGNGSGLNEMTSRSVYFPITLQEVDAAMANLRALQEPPRGMVRIAWETVHLGAIGDRGELHPRGPGVWHGSVRWYNGSAVLAHIKGMVDD